MSSVVYIGQTYIDQPVSTESVEQTFESCPEREADICAEFGANLDFGKVLKI